MSATPWAPRLMLVTDARRSRLPLLDLVAEAVAGGVDAVYLRDVDPTTLDGAALVRQVRENIREEGTACLAPPPMLMINCDPGTARALGVGLHLRERDISPAEARALCGPAVSIGKSVHTVEGARAAAEADYLLAGHVFPTASKPGRAPLGLEEFAAIAAAAPCPTLAIGGITGERIADVIQAGAAGVAMIGAIAEASDPRAAAAILRAAIDDATQRQHKEPPMNEPPAVDVAATVDIVVNGKAVAVPAGATVHDFLVGKRMTDAMAIIEHNGVILPRAEYGTTTLQVGDVLEVVHAVGGG